VCTVNGLKGAWHHAVDVNVTNLYQYKTNFRHCSFLPVVSPLQPMHLIVYCPCVEVPVADNVIKAISAVNSPLSRTL